MTDFRDVLHPRDRRGRWSEALDRALGPDPLGYGAAGRLLSPDKRTSSVPAGEVAALRHLAPGESVTLPRGTRVTRHVSDLSGDRDFHVRVDPSTVAARSGAENAAALGVPDAAPRDLRDVTVTQPQNDYRPPRPNVRVSDYALPAPPPVPVDPDTAVIARSPGRAPSMSTGRTKPRTVVELTRGDAGEIADAIGGLKAYGPGPLPTHKFFDGVAKGGDSGERMRLSLRDETLAVAREAMGQKGERPQSSARAALYRVRDESLYSPGRVRETDAERTARARAAQAGPKPPPVGDLFTAIGQAVEVVAARRDGRQARRLAGAPPLASPGRAEPPYPEGGVSIVSRGYRMGPYGSWEQAADQLLRERAAGATGGHAKAGLRADRDLTAEEQRHLVELAASRALSAQEARVRDREQLAAISRAARA